MTQVQEYKGYFRNGRFVSSEAVNLPDNVEVIVKVTGQIIPFRTAEEKIAPEQQAALNFLTAIESINREGFTEEDIDSFAMWDRGEFRLDFAERLS